MGVAGAGEIFGRTAEFHQHGDFVDEVARARADDVGAEHLVGGGVGENLDEAVGMADRPGAAVGGEGEFADVVGRACRLQLLLQADQCISSATGPYVGMQG